ncbi:hypothetical protein CEUSTIGMA_g30.t1 [Chlamydomonas eustigma]|uniref:CDC20/Fizzy WD40 domain-containing protein n=1 Tax=Chlamydomonas eustigma TaxID=1157962 RepID=A0A250WP13_9CHLO|nr:hypothetical protein CEUSTIGMA_g30.t1 [Chlamydomonas eustigma]|eukprot:GAX72574.1 hypothetical protein CEUSTIGMA_g30.t1 [Chlamydomonas eustigma]
MDMSISDERISMSLGASASTEPRMSGSEAQRKDRAPPSTPTKSPSYLWSPKSKIVYSDRFIPSRAVAARLDFSVLDRERVSTECTQLVSGKEDMSSAYDMLLRTEMLGAAPLIATAAPARPTNNEPAPTTSTATTVQAQHSLKTYRVPSSPSKLFRYLSGDAQSPMGGATPASPFSRSLVGDDTVSSPLASPKLAARKIPRAPFKVLDAPALQDDFYLNLVDWSAQNVLAVGLGSCVYLWSAHTSKVTKLCELPSNDAVSSVSWSHRGTYLSLGTQSGKVQIWDVVRAKALRTMDGHKGRVGTQAWSSNILSSGSRDRSILHRDVRAKEHFCGRLLGHRSEVCGLKWSPDNQQLASGGNDNHLYVWSAQSSSPICNFSDHVAAVKAIAWSPHQHGLLASGGGTADRCIRFWNTVSGTPLSCVDTGSQVCNLVWSKNVNEIVSTHGYSQNQVVVWKYPDMTKLATLTGHSLRVLYLAASPDGQTIVTGAGDETLRFWNIFPDARSQAGLATEGSGAVSLMLRSIIR